MVQIESLRIYILARRMYCRVITNINPLQIDLYGMTWWIRRESQEMGFENYEIYKKVVCQRDRRAKRQMASWHQHKK